MNIKLGIYVIFFETVKEVYIFINYNCIKLNELFSRKKMSKKLIKIFILFNIIINS